MSFNINLSAHSRIYNSTGQCNAPGNTIKGVRLVDYDEARQIFLIRGDPVNAPESWFEIALPVRLVRSLLDKANLKEDKEEEEEVPEDVNEMSSSL
jgi:hypothetical protein